jgi:hypothetical protein
MFQERIERICVSALQIASASLPCLIYRDGVYRNSLELHNHRNEVVEIGQIEFTNQCCRRVRERRAPGGLKRIFEQVRNE